MIIILIYLYLRISMRNLQDQESTKKQGID